MDASESRRQQKLQVNNYVGPSSPYAQNSGGSSPSGPKPFLKAGQGALRPSRPSTAQSLRSAYSGSSDGVLKPDCRHVHAQAMTNYYDHESLAEEWHNLLCMLDPTHPEYVNTPIAEQLDPYTLAYTILLLKEGLFGRMPEPAQYALEQLKGSQAGALVEDWSQLSAVLDGLLDGALGKTREGARMRPASARIHFHNMTSQEKIDLLRRIYGHGKLPQRRSPNSAARSRLYDHLRLGKHLDMLDPNNLAGSDAKSPDAKRSKSPVKKKKKKVPASAPALEPTNLDDPLGTLAEEADEYGGGVFEDEDPNDLATDAADLQGVVPDEKDAGTRTGASIAVQVGPGAWQGVDTGSQWDAADLLALLLDVVPVLAQSWAETGPITLDPKAVGSYLDEVNASIAALTDAMANAGNVTSSGGNSAADGSGSLGPGVADGSVGGSNTSVGAKGTGVGGEGVPRLSAEEMAARLQQLSSIQGVLQAAQDKLQKRLERSTLAAGPGFIAGSGSGADTDTAAGSSAGRGGAGGRGAGAARASSSKGHLKGGRGAGSGAGAARVSGAGDAASAASMLEDQLAAMMAAMAAAQQQWAAAQLGWGAGSGTGAGSGQTDPFAEGEDPFADSPLPAISGLLQQMYQAGDALTSACAATGASLMGPYAGTKLGAGSLSARLLAAAGGKQGAGAGGEGGSSQAGAGSGTKSGTNSRATTPGRAPSVGRGGSAAKSGTASSAAGTSAASGRFTSPGTSRASGMAASGDAAVSAGTAGSQMAAAFDALTSAAARMKQLLDTLCGMVRMAQRMLDAQQDPGPDGQLPPSLTMVSALSGIADDLKAAVAQNVSGVLRCLHGMRAELEGGAGSGASNAAVSGSSSSGAAAPGAPASPAGAAPAAGSLEVQRSTTDAPASADAESGAATGAGTGAAPKGPGVMGPAFKEHVRALLRHLHALTMSLASCAERLIKLLAASDRPAAQAAASRLLSTGVVEGLSIMAYHLSGLVDALDTLYGPLEDPEPAPTAPEASSQSVAAAAGTVGVVPPASPSGGLAAEPSLGTGLGSAAGDEGEDGGEAERQPGAQEDGAAHVSAADMDGTWGSFSGHVPQMAAEVEGAPAAASAPPAAPAPVPAPATGEGNASEAPAAATPTPEPGPVADDPVVPATDVVSAVSEAQGPTALVPGRTPTSVTVAHGLSDREGVLRAVFGQLDADGSGVIDKAEMLAALGAMGKLAGGPLLEQLESQLAAMDASGDSNISLDEFLEHMMWVSGVLEDDANFVAYLKDVYNVSVSSEADDGGAAAVVALSGFASRREVLDAAFAAMDKDGSGFIEREELKAALSKMGELEEGRVSEAVTREMDAMDTNGDGKISRDEFVEHMAWTSAFLSDEEFFIYLNDAFHLRVEGEADEEAFAELRQAAAHITATEGTAGVDVADGPAAVAAGSGPVAEAVEGGDLAHLSLRAQAASASRSQSVKRRSSSGSTAHSASIGLGGAGAGGSVERASPAGSRPLSRQSSMRSTASGHTSNSRLTGGPSSLTVPTAPSPPLSRASSRGRGTPGATGSGPPSRSASKSRDLYGSGGGAGPSTSRSGSAVRGARAPGSHPPTPGSGQSRSVSRGRDGFGGSSGASASKSPSGPYAPTSARTPTRPPSNPRGAGATRSRSQSRDGRAAGSGPLQRSPSRGAAGGRGSSTGGRASATAGRGADGPSAKAGGSNLSESERKSLVFMWSLMPVVEGYLVNLRMWLGVVLAGMDGVWEAAREQAVLDAATYPSKGDALAQALARLKALEAQLAGMADAQAQLDKLAAELAESKKRLRELESAGGSKARALDGLPEGGSEEDALQARIRELEKQLADEKKKPAPPVVEKGCCGC